MPVGRGCVALIACLLSGVFSPARAVDVREVEIRHQGRTYSVRFDVTLAADASRARTILTDYRQWPRLSESITDSRLLLTHADGTERVSVTFSGCVLVLFCRTVRQVKDLHLAGNGDSYDAELVPNQGDFASGKELWRIAPLSAQATRLEYRATLVIGFDLPPLVGPWLLKRQLADELLRTAANVELLSR